MMGVQSLLDFIETNYPSACQPVDLLEISRGSSSKRSRGDGDAGLCLVIDAESCLDRLYGGYFSDWVCGGQWNRMLQFLTNVVQVCKNAQLQLVVFFNGALEQQQLGEWAKTQVSNRDKVMKIFRHIHLKGTPPPKIWWLPPTCVRTSLRMALRHLGVSVASSMDDHRQEVIAYLRENNFDGLLAQEADYAIFDPPRYFSAHYLKLKFSGNLVTKEYIMDEVAKSLDLHPNRFCVFGALLGNHILPQEDLREFFCHLLKKKPRDMPFELKDELVIPAVVRFVRNLDSVDDLAAVGRQVFLVGGYGSESMMKKKIAQLQQSVQYYLNGTEEGFLKYLPRIQGAFAAEPPPEKASRQPGGYPEKGAEEGEELEGQPPGPESVYSQGESGYGLPSLPTPSIVIEPPSQLKVERPELHAALRGKIKQLESEREEEEVKPSGSGRPKLSDPHKLSSMSSSSSSSNSSSPNRLSPEASLPSMKFTSKQAPGTKMSAEKLAEAGVGPLLVSPEIMRIASERHQKGLMSPFIYQVLTQGEVKINVCLEDEQSKDLPSAVDFFRPIRQSMYGILFNTNAGQSKRPLKEGTPDAIIKEWVVRPGSDCATQELVRGTKLDWSSQVPTVKRLWLGQLVEDKNRRLRAFLSCMGGDYSPLMLNTSYVPQHLLILCCVLRFMMMKKDGCLLRKHELDAFLAQSVSHHLHTYHLHQEIQVPSIHPRGVHLATLFMSGVESAIYANDVCGAPIPWSMCCPWMFFDGKVFHFKLLKASSGVPLVDLCDGQVDIVMRVERMRQAIMEGVSFEFARPSFGTGSPSMSSSMYEFQPAGGSPQGTPPRPKPGFGRGRGGGAGPPGPPGSMFDPRGGELEVAGVVVGSWAGQRRRGGPGMPPPQPMPPSAGRARRGGYGLESPPRGPMRGRGLPPPPFGHPMYQPPPPGPGFVGRGRGVFRGAGPARYLGKPRSSTSHTPRGGRGGGGGCGPRGRGCTVESADGSGAIYVSQLSTEPECQYKDSEGDTSGASIESGRSPDSGIHVPSRVKSETGE